MPTLETSARNGAADGVVDLIDVGGAGTFVLETSGDVEVATLTFNATAFGDASVGVATANPITEDSSATGGVVAQASCVSGGAAKIVEFSVATSGQDIDITTTTIVATETVTASSLTLTMPAS